MFYGRKSGNLPGIMDKLMVLTKPEAAYFTADGGTRTAFIFFDMQDSAQLPSIGELLFQNFEAKVELMPAMNGDDLQRGLAAAMNG